jgi:hypothetical protein
MLKLTKASKEQLYNQHNGTGVVFLKTGNKKMYTIEFYLGRNKKFYLINNAVPAIELTKALNDSIPEIEEELEEV